MAVVTAAGQPPVGPPHQGIDRAAVLEDDGFALAVLGPELDLAVFAAILAVPTAIAGIYGMNFKYIPEIEWTYGYFVVIPVIFLICGYLYQRFRRSGWL